ncbi:MAG: transcription elongation factor GreA [Bacillota bacterium]
MSTQGEEILLSPRGKEKLQEELEYLKNVRRRDVAEKIRIARSHGDLSENAEYDEAKKEQAVVESRIAQIEVYLRRARIVRREDIEENRVNVGSRVTVTDVDRSEQITYRIVGGAKESDPARKMISYRSPVGGALYGNSVGDTVRVRLPAGTRTYRIDEVEWTGEAIE